MDTLTDGDGELLIERVSEFLRRNSPPLDDILGAICELYRVDPDAIADQRGIVARHMYCYLAVRWTTADRGQIGNRIAVGTHAVKHGFNGVASQLDNALVRDDLDLLALRIAERVMARRRVARHGAHA